MSYIRDTQNTIRVLSTVIFCFVTIIGKCAVVMADDRFLYTLFLVITNHKHRNEQKTLKNKYLI